MFVIMLQKISHHFPSRLEPFLVKFKSSYEVFSGGFTHVNFFGNLWVGFNVVTNTVKGLGLTQYSKVAVAD